MELDMETILWIHMVLNAAKDSLLNRNDRLIKLILNYLFFSMNFFFYFILFIYFFLKVIKKYVAKNVAKAKDLADDMVKGCCYVK